MATSTKIRGRNLALQFEGQDYWADHTSVVLDNEEGETDVVTFYDAANPGQNRQYYFQLSAIQSTAVDSFWRYLWDHVGEIVPFTYAPHGNEEPEAGRPHFIGTARILARPPIGGEAGQNVTYTFDARLDVETGPVLDDGSNGNGGGGD